MSKTKIALVGNDDFSIWHFRRALIGELVRRNYDVSIVVPVGAYFEKLSSTGARCIGMPMQRFMSPLHDLWLFFRLLRLFKRERFGIVHTMTIKPNIYATLAAALCGVPERYCLISGLGFMFAGKTAHPSLRQRIARQLYRIGLQRCTRAAFQNPDDKDFFVKQRLVPAERAIVILGSGVDTNAFSRDTVSEPDISELKKKLGLDDRSKCVVLVAARMIWSKGIREFVEAAAALKETFPVWRFILVAPRERGTPDEVPENYFTKLPENLIVVDEFQHEIKLFLALSDIAVLPSYYPEGVPRSLLEAMSFSCPVITTDMPGCRETVEEGKNGFLIPPKDTGALIDRLTVLMAAPELRSRMGSHSRRLVNEKFSETGVVRQIFENLYHVKD